MKFCPKCGNRFYSVYDIEKALEQEGGKKSNNNFKKIITKLRNIDDITALIKHVDITALYDSEEYKKLEQPEKKKIFDKVSKAIVDNERMDSRSSRKKGEYVMYQFCKNCFYNEDLDTGSTIFSKNYKHDKGMSSLIDYTHLVNSNILPRTTMYRCINPKCETHKNPKIKEAVFITDRTNNLLIYICTVCKTQWTN